MKIAVASKDGLVINQHFGHAERFLIYEIRKSPSPLSSPHRGEDTTQLSPLPFGERVRVRGEFEIKFVEERFVEKYCSGQEGHLYDDDKFEKVYAAVKDCGILLVSRIGATPERELERRGIKTFMLYDWIEEGIKTVLSDEL